MKTPMPEAALSFVELPEGLDDSADTVCLLKSDERRERCITTLP